VDVQRSRDAVVGRDDDGVPALPLGEIAIDRLHLVRDVGPTHAVGEELVLGIQPGGVKTIRWRYGKGDLREDEELERRGNDNRDMQAEAQLGALYAGDGHQPLSQDDRDRPDSVVGLADEEEEKQRNGACDTDRAQELTAEQ
jgi:hypothetical protein